MLNTTDMGRVIVSLILYAGSCIYVSTVHCVKKGAKALRLPCGKLLGSLLGLSISSAAGSGPIVAPGDAVHAMDALTSMGVLLGLTLPATVWIVLAGVGALVYLISHRS